MQTHEELHAETLDAARKEKSATLELLRFLKQIEERRTFAVMGYPSLFKYVEEGLGYSPAQASERVSAMRLLRQVPAVAENLRDGAHTLTSIAKLASHVRREGLKPEQASALVLESANQTVVSLEKHLAGVALVEPPKLERAKIISRELTRLTLDVDDEFMALVQRMKELKGNPALPLSEVFASAMQEFVKKREVKNPDVKNPSENSPEKSQQNKSSTSGAEVKSKPSEVKTTRTRYIRVHDRRIVRIRAHDECEYTHEETGKRCGSKTGLQFEHITPFAHGGGNREENLKLYCAAHNRLSAIRVYGEEKMRPFMRC
jgi:5-methylcytosine-specific restriction endonuclease McrA